jgi:hypothetical protein
MQCRKTVGFPSKVVTFKGVEKRVLKKQKVTAGLRNGSNSGLKS